MSDKLLFYWNWDWIVGFSVSCMCSVLLYWIVVRKTKTILLNQNDKPLAITTTLTTCVSTLTAFSLMWIVGCLMLLLNVVNITFLILDYRDVYEAPMSLSIITFGISHSLTLLAVFVYYMTYVAFKQSTKGRFIDHDNIDTDNDSDQTVGR